MHGVKGCSQLRIEAVDPRTGVGNGNPPAGLSEGDDGPDSSLLKSPHHSFALLRRQLPEDNAPVLVGLFGFLAVELRAVPWFDAPGERAELRDQPNALYVSPAATEVGIPAANQGYGISRPQSIRRQSGCEPPLRIAMEILAVKRGLNGPEVIPGQLRASANGVRRKHEHEEGTPRDKPPVE